MHLKSNFWDMEPPGGWYQIRLIFLRSKDVAVQKMWRFVLCLLCHIQPRHIAVPWAPLLLLTCDMLQRRQAGTLKSGAAQQRLREGYLNAVKDYSDSHKMEIHDILDVGCSVGVSTEYIAEKWPQSRITGVSAGLGHQTPLLHVLAQPNPLFHSQRCFEVSGAARVDTQQTACSNEAKMPVGARGLPGPVVEIWTPVVGSEQPIVLRYSRRHYRYSSHRSSHSPLPAPHKQAGPCCCAKQGFLVVSRHFGLVWAGGPALSQSGLLYPPPPLSCKCPCLVSAGGGGEGTVTFPFPNFHRGLDIEVLLCVCWLDKVLLLVHCCVLPISCMEALHCTLYHAEHLVFRNFSHE